MYVDLIFYENFVPYNYRPYYYSINARIKQGGKAAPEHFRQGGLKLFTFSTGLFFCEREVLSRQIAEKFSLALTRFVVYAIIR